MQNSIRLFSALFVGVLAGGAATFFATRSDMVPLPMSWKLVDLENAASSKRSNDDEACYPSPAILTNEQRSIVREGRPIIYARLSENERPMLDRIIEGDGPIPYKGQRAARTALITLALDGYARCVGDRNDKTDCDKGAAAHVIESKSDLPTAAADLGYKIGIWSQFLRRDLESSAFCVATKN